MSIINPLLENPKNEFGLIDLNSIKPEHFVPALQQSIKEALKSIQVIVQNDEPSTFENTIEALEFSTETVDLVSETFFNLLQAEADEKMHGLAEEISQKLSQFTSDILLNAELFGRIQSVYESQKKLNLTPEQKKLLEKTYKSFVRNGALLTDDQKLRLRQIDEELATLGPKFSENLLKSTNSFEILLTAEQAKGIPQTVLEIAKESAQAKGKEGYLFNLQAPSVIPLLTYCEDRAIREKVWRAYNSRGLNDPFNNQSLLIKIAQLRYQRAQLLGYQHHAHFVLEERMAETSEKVNLFLKKILEVSKKAAEAEFAELKAFAQTISGLEQLKPWDYSYFAEKLKKQKFDFDPEELRPYFSLDKVIAGLFEVAHRLYDLDIVEVKNVPKYHPEVRTYKVTDKKSNSYLGLLMGDFFPRETKKSGAWMTNFVDQGYLRGKLMRPIVSIVCNFTRPTSQKPALLTLEEVKTLFHEFGHALHSLLSQCHYRSLSGPKVYWDFVELPSQIMENWVLEKETLDFFATHYETHAPIPNDLVQKLKLAEKFHAGWFSLRQVNFGILDMAWHQGPIPQNVDVEKFEEEVTRPSSFFPKEPQTSISTGFAHIFSGGYSAGYYSYKWAEVLDADAYEYFKENGIFNKKIAQKFREEILAKGGSEHPMTLYKRFRGREPDPNALFRRDGFA